MSPKLAVAFTWPLFYYRDFSATVETKNKNFNPELRNLTSNVVVIYTTSLSLINFRGIEGLYGC